MSHRRFWALFWALFLVLAFLGAWFLGNLAYTVLWAVLGKWTFPITEVQMVTYIAANLLPFVLILIVGGLLSLLIRHRIASAPQTVPQQDAFFFNPSSGRPTKKIEIEYGEELASAEDRLPESLCFGECDAIVGVVRVGSVHKASYGHKWEGASAPPLVA